MAGQIRDALNGSGTKAAATQAGQRIGLDLTTAMGGELSRGGAQAGKRAADGLSSATAQFESAGHSAAQKYLGGFHSEAEFRGARIGTTVGTVIGRSIGGAINVGIKGAAVGAAGAVAAVTYTLGKGFQRLEKIDQAQFKLQALGHSAGEVEKIMGSAQKSVKGTAFALDEAANTAASAVAAGVKPGEQLTEYLENIADAAAVAGVSFEEMASIFNKARTNTVVYTDDLQQLADRGIPIFQWLAEEYGVTQQQLTKMVEQGQVDAQHFEAAIDKHIGGAALKTGQSWSGAVDNLQASVARVGANFLTQIFGGDNTSALAGPTAAVESLTGKLNEFDGWVTAHGPEIKGFFNDAKEVGRAFVDAIVPPLQTAGNLLRGASRLDPRRGRRVRGMENYRGCRRPDHQP
jgi:tape measure domain-containing protein